ncbi:MAG: hypothetical protein KIH63_001780 [Candidatus Saccharibacteria bacterium]|nr:hypothetical protein [Candidatus Saccharibacteria bacterium]
MVQFSIKKSTPVTSSQKNTKRFGFTKIPKWLLALLFVGVVVLAYGAFRYVDKPDQLTEDTTPISQTSTNQDIDFSPATEEDKADIDSRKADLGNTTQPTTPPNTLKTVTPVIVGSSNSPVSVRSYVSGVIESGGICTLTLTNGISALTTEGEASAGPQTTDCPELSIATVSPGTWKATISYKSTTSQGTSSQDWEITL